MHGELRAIETQLQGSGPWDFSGQALQDSAGGSSSGGQELKRELVIVHTPGHTRGHTCLYYAPSKVLFAGGLACAGSSRLHGKLRARQLSCDLNGLRIRWHVEGRVHAAAIDV